MTPVRPCGMATGWQQNIPHGQAAPALERGCPVARQSRVLSWFSLGRALVTGAGTVTRQHHSCLAAVPPHTHGIYCSPQPAISSRSGSRLSKAHRVCPPACGDTGWLSPASGSIFSPLGPSVGDRKGPVSRATRGGCRSARCAPRMHPSPVVQGERCWFFSQWAQTDVCVIH